MKQNILFFTFVLSLLLTYQLSAQEYHQSKSFDLDSEVSGSHIYEARDYITLDKGFIYSPDGTSTFTAQINSKLLFPDSSNLYMTESGDLTSDPEDGYAVGAIPGTFNVSATGAATYTIPIDVAPGVNGMQPNIALAYNSQAGNGIAGWGWNISGMSAITRVPKTYYYDEEAEGIVWGSAGVLALDGNRLFVVDDSNSPDSIVYRTEVDNGQRIVGYDIDVKSGIFDLVFSNLPTYFKVWTKDGKVIKYGISDNSRLRTLFYTYSWNIEKLEDNNNNYVAYNYTYSSATINSLRNSFRVNTVSYGNCNNEIGKIKFEYTSRNNTYYKYIRGRSYMDEYKLSTIGVYSDNTNLRNYTLDYNDDEKLISVGLKGLNNEKLKETTFEWSQPEYNSSFTGQMTFNLTEYCNVIIDDGYNDSQSCQIVATGDVDGDDVLEVAVKWILGNKYYISTDIWGNKKYGWEYMYVWAIYKSNGINNVYDYILEDNWSTSGNVSDITNFYFLDTNDDGKDEFYYHTIYNEDKTSGSRSINGIITGYKYDENDEDFDKIIYGSSCHYLSSGTYGVYGATQASVETLIPGDFVGDGHIRFAQIDDGNNFVGLTDITNPQICEIIDGDKYKTDYLLTDINGNGKVEILAIKNDGAHFYEYQSMDNSGCVFSNIANITSDDDDSVYPKFGNKFSIGDFNGDGNSDLFVHSWVVNDDSTPDGYYIWFSEGDGSFEKIKLPDGMCPPNSTPGNYSFTAIDINYDGLSDVAIKSYDKTSDKSYLNYYISNGDGSFSLDYSEEITGVRYDGEYYRFEECGNYYNDNSISGCLRCGNNTVYGYRISKRSELIKLNENALFNKIKTINYADNNISVKYKKLRENRNKYLKIFNVVFCSHIVQYFSQILRQ